MKIDVLFLTGKRMRFEIDGSHTLYDLKDKIEDTEGIPWHQQRLVLGGKQLSESDGGSLMDEIELIRDADEELRRGSLIVISLILRLRGGGNKIFHMPRPPRDEKKLTRIRRISIVDSESDDDSGGGQALDDRQVQPVIQSSSDQFFVSSPRLSLEDELSQNGMSSTNLALVQSSSDTSLPKNRLKKFGFGSNKTTYPLEAPPINEKGFGFEKIKESDFQKVKRTTEGGLSQVLFEIPPSVIEHIKGKETNVLYCEGIDQIIQGMYLLQLFRSRVESEKQMALSEQTPQIEELIRMVSMTQFALDRSNKEVLELREERSELKNEIANLKRLANDVGNQGYDRGYERAVKDVEECITNEHPEWDLSSSNLRS